MENSFSISSAMRDAWRSAKTHRGLLAKAILTAGLLQIASAIFDVKEVHTSGDVTRVLVSIIAGIAAAVCMTGLLAIAIKLAKGHSAQYSELIPSWHVLWRFALVSIVVGVFVILGFIALIIPGIYLALRFSMARMIILDSPDTGIFDALRKSTEMTRGIKWELLGLMLVILVINIIGIIPVGLGLLVTIPVSMLAVAHVYVKLKDRVPSPIEQ